MVVGTMMDSGMSTFVANATSDHEITCGRVSRAVRRLFEADGRP